jgi:IS5 family transposase
MYKYSADFTDQLELFELSLPFGGKLDQQNRWIQLSSLIDWRGFEYAYGKLFSHTGRPALSARLVIGALIIKHVKGLSDEEVVEEIVENPYLQFFIGLKRFQYEVPFDDSSLSVVRKRLGEETFAGFERAVIERLVERKLIKPRGVQTDATVFESEITYPTDTGLLNKARLFCVDQIRRYSKVVDKKVRTYCRVAQRAYVNFSKKRRKTKKQIRTMQKQLLQYLGRNMRQLAELMEAAAELGHRIPRRVVERFETIKRIYDQQREMYQERKHSIESRIVSVHKPHVRPIVRGKAGKDVEFGAKVELSYVDGYVFCDEVSFENFNESGVFIEGVEKFRERFGKYPDHAVMDHIYGTRENRRYLKEHGIRSAVKPLGRGKQGSPEAERERRWRRQKQRERNRIEGSIGYGKTNFGLGLIRARLPETEISWIKMGLMAQNLITATQRI